MRDGDVLATPSGVHLPGGPRQSGHLRSVLERLSWRHSGPCTCLKSWMRECTTSTSVDRPHASAPCSRHRGFISLRERRVRRQRGIPSSVSAASSTSSRTRGVGAIFEIERINMVRGMGNDIPVVRANATRATVCTGGEEDTLTELEAMRESVIHRALVNLTTGEHPLAPIELARPTWQAVSTRNCASSSDTTCTHEPRREGVHRLGRTLDEYEYWLLIGAQLIPTSPRTHHWTPLNR